MTLYPPVPVWLQESAAEFLTADEAAQLRVLFARLWPADSRLGIPGAVDVGAVTFVSRLLARPADVFRDIPKWQGQYRDGLAALDAHARATHGKGLADLADAEADALLAGLEKQALTALPLSPNTTQYALFDTLRRHCIQGSLCDPRWGGNEDRHMWRALGILQPAEGVA